MEEVTKLHPNIKFVSCHPGWTQTEGVDAAYGDRKKWLEPLRTPWQGCDGICWLTAVKGQELEGGAFYLDREPQRKHLAGAFFSEGSFTKNSSEQVAEMMEKLEMWSSSATRPNLENFQYPADPAKLPKKLKETSTAMDIEKFMGTWYVWANIPTRFEVGSSDNVETYTWNPTKKLIEVSFEYYPGGQTKASSFLQQATISNPPTNTRWAICPQVFGIFLPANLAYLVLYCAPDYSHCVIGVENRSYLWIMGRVPPPQLDEQALEHDMNLAVSLGYDRRKIVRVPWMGKSPSSASTSSHTNAGGSHDTGSGSGSVASAHQKSKGEGDGDS